MPNEAILDALQEELDLQARLQSARSTAVSAAVTAIVVKCQDFIDFDKAAGMSYAIGRLIDQRFDKFDIVEAMKGVVEYANWRKSTTFKADPRALAESLSPESRTALAERMYSFIGRDVAIDFIAQLKANRK